jgi:hypothetical protein
MLVLHKIDEIKAVISQEKAKNKLLALFQQWELCIKGTFL